MPRCGKAAHIHADFGNQHLCGDIANPRHGCQSVDFGTKGVDGRTHLLINGGDCFFQRLDLIQM
jgi:hypothetical protein